MQLQYQMLRVKEHTPTACCLPRMATNTSCTMIKRPFLSSLTLPEFRITLRASSYVYCTAPCPCCVKPLTSRICQSPPEIRMDVFKHRCRLKAKGALKHLFCPETIGQQAPKPTARFVRGCFQIETCTTSILRSFDFAKC